MTKLKNTLIIFSFATIIFAKAEDTPECLGFSTGTFAYDAYKYLTSNKFVPFVALWTIVKDLDRYLNELSGSDLSVIFQRDIPKSESTPEGKLAEFVLLNRFHWEPKQVMPLFPQERSSLTQDIVDGLIASKRYLGEGCCATAYKTEYGAFVLKVYRMLSEKANNELFKGCVERLDPTQDYCKHIYFFPEYYGTFKGSKDFEGKDLGAFEMVEGLSLANDKFPIKEIPMSKLCFIWKQIALAADFLHNIGIIDTDLKTDNILCCPMGGRIKFVDFGGFKSLIALLTNTEKFISSPLFSPSELNKAYLYSLHKISGSAKELYRISPATNIYQIGMTILDLLCKRKGCLIENLLEEPYRKKQDLHPCILELVQLVCAPENFDSICDPQIVDHRESKVFVYTEASEFTNCLLKDCLEIDPSKRPSAIQLAEILQTLGLYFEAKEAREDISLKKYSDTKKEAELKHPQTIPISLTRALLSAYQDHKLPCNAIFRLAELLGPSLEDSPTFGLALYFRALDNKALGDKPLDSITLANFEKWTEEHSDAFKQLINRIYTLGFKRKPNKDMPLPPKDCKAIRAYTQPVLPPGTGHP